MSLMVEDRDGAMGDIVMGYHTPEEYIAEGAERFFGCVCGRFANRIGKGRFEIDGVEYKLLINNAGNALHGGLKGFDSVVWDVVDVTDSSIAFRYVSPDGEEGYPGELTVDMLYELTEEGEFVIEYEARTTKATHINLTHHSYFNLSGEGRGDVCDHTIRINGDSYLVIDETSLPTGEIASVEGTPFDLRVATRIGDQIDNNDNEQIRIGHGYDHCWVLNGREGAMRLAAQVVDPATGRMMEVYTDQPGMQFYSSNWTDGTVPSKDGKGSYLRRGALALETQLFPDAPNKPQFPSSLLLPDETYTHRCIYKFGLAED